MVYQFEVFGPLRVQKQTQFARRGESAIVYDPSKKDKEQIRWQIRPFAPEKPLTCACELTLAFFFAIPKAASKLMRQQMLNRVIVPDKRPDFDNLAYLVTNALQDLVYDDDKRVCAAHIYKFYGAEEKTIIRVRPILQSTPMGLPDAPDI